MGTFERDRERIMVAILRLAILVEERIFDAIRALRDRRPDLADAVIDGDEAVDRLEVGIEEDCLRFLAKHDPVAVDLRRVAAILKVNHELERMAYEAVGIAQRAAELAALPPADSIPEELEEMTARVTAMVRGSLDAFVDSDAGRARGILAMGDDVDRLHRRIVAVAKGIIRGGPDSIEAGLHIFSAAGHLERIAGHASSIAEEVAYLAAGSILRHRHEDGSGNLRRACMAQGPAIRQFPT